MKFKENMIPFIGGKPATDAQKKVNLELIDQAIVNNVNGKLTMISNDVFAHSYPDSVDKITEYYHSVIYFYKHFRYGCTKSVFGSKHPKELAKIAEAKEKYYNTSLIYGPLLEKNMDDYIDKFDIPLETMERLLNYYKVYSFRKNAPFLGYNETKARYTVSKLGNQNMEKIGDLLAKQLLQGKSIKDLCDHYQISEDRFKTYIHCISNPETIEKINQIKSNIQDKKQMKINTIPELVNQIRTYILRGIPYEVETIPFTLLDYLSLTDIAIREVYDYLLKNPSNGNLAKVDAIIKKMCQKAKLSQVPMNPNKFGKEDCITFTINGKQETKYFMDYIPQVFAELNNKNIVADERLVKIALERVVRDEPVFPISYMAEQEQTKKTL